MAHRTSPRNPAPVDYSESTLHLTHSPGQRRITLEPMSFAPELPRLRNQSRFLVAMAEPTSPQTPVLTSADFEVSRDTFARSGSRTEGSLVAEESVMKPTKRSSRNKAKATETSPLHRLVLRRFKHTPRNPHTPPRPFLK
jgi:hypothetical protein